ncbi:hypothetical protein F4561_001777 [Lipingzhangella halophila]|uniref:Uncharacterized protein n=1 Tax=Lipingzhangella halophila TaxID=1783352 RepID=A0A7W7W1H0_9ACTN|nr:hypothetical protein [Lipingzhangella halophila]MBB4930957.1 hypothetical protein [Lipingzhangella halophila]
MFLVSLVIVVAALIVIAVAVVIAETTLVYIALGLAGVSAVLLTVEMIRHREELGFSALLTRQGASAEARDPRTDGLGKASVPAAAMAAQQETHSGNSVRVPASAEPPVRGAVYSAWNSEPPGRDAAIQSGAAATETEHGDRADRDSGPAPSRPAYEAAPAVPEPRAREGGTAEEYAGEAEDPAATAAVPGLDAAADSGSADSEDERTIPAGEPADGGADTEDNQGEAAAAALPESVGAAATEGPSWGKAGEDEPAESTEALGEASVEDAAGEPAPDGVPGDHALAEDVSAEDAPAEDAPAAVASFSSFVERLQQGAAPAEEREPAEEPVGDAAGAGSGSDGSEDAVTGTAGSAGSAEPAEDGALDDETAEVAEGAGAADDTPGSVAEPGHPEFETGLEADDPYPAPGPGGGLTTPDSESAEPDLAAEDAGSGEAMEVQAVPSSGDTPAVDIAGEDAAPENGGPEPGGTGFGGSGGSAAEPEESELGEPAADTDATATADPEDTPAADPDAEALDPGDTSDADLDAEETAGTGAAESEETGTGGSGATTPHGAERD